MAKIRITENQYQLIVNYQNNNLNESIVLKEGWKEIVLGTAMLLGLNLSGQNKLIAQDSIKNKAILGQIKNTLESDKIEDIAQSLEDAGLRNAMDRIELNAKSIEDKFNKFANDEGLNYKLSIKTAESEKALRDKLKQGYALKDIKTKKDTVNQDVKKIIEVTDTLDVSFGADNFFITAGYKLSEGGLDSVKSALSAVEQQGGTILSVNIESSTDTEPIKMGNEKLSQLRTNSVKEVLLQSGVDGNNITTTVLANQGENLYSTTMSTEQRIAARKQTSKYRYVKLTITAIFKSEITEINVAPQIIETKQFEVVKIIENTARSKKIGAKAKFHKKHKHCRIIEWIKSKKKKNVSACPIWNK